MTREEIMTLGFEELEERKAAIAVETDEADAEVIETLNAELEIIEERTKALNLEIEERKKAAEAVKSGAGKPVEVRKESEKMTEKEIRNSKEYLDAWVEMQKGRATVEQRALLTENAESNGTIAVPVYVEDRVNTAWDNNEIIRRVKRTYFKGNLRVPVEVSASGAAIHAEGGDPITEEELVIQFVNLVPRTFKKMVKYSTEVMDLKGQAWIDYIFDEIEYQIVKKVVEAVVASTDSNLVAAYTAAGATLTAADVVNAEGLLGGEASNPVLITTRARAAALKAAALSAGYGYDPFDGMEVLYVDQAALTPSNSLAIIADLSGIQVNFPNGDQPTFVFDEYTDAPSDIVRVIGRLMAAVGVIAKGKIVCIEPGE